MTYQGSGVHKGVQGCPRGRQGVYATEEREAKKSNREEKEKFEKNILQFREEKEKGISFLKVREEKEKFFK